MELSTGIESLPREETDNIAGGITTSRSWCHNTGLCGETDDFTESC
ncbi:MAG: hypothetical protein HRT37_03050 [Alteromonadaceae bacterium]|nr:hypothetical protein [Alteromonadaceae bacterium]